ncbi:MAG: orotate phosphoribosyltransferase [Candidatus Thorarchaeota archaeon]
MNDTRDLQALKQKIMSDIYKNRMLLTSFRDRPEGWTMISGLWSPFYLQLRVLSSFPQTLKIIGQAMSVFLEDKAPDVNKLVGIAFAGVPIATAISLESGIPACHTRKIQGVRTMEDFQKALAEYGQHSLVEGIIKDGDNLCIVDDLVTGLETKLVARAQIMTEIEKRGITDVTCDDIAVIVDRQQGAEEKAKQAGLRLHSLIKFVDVGLPIIKDLMEPEEYKIVSEYLANPQHNR